MLCLIPIPGGLLIMMGQHDRSEALFYYFRLEDQVPESHLLRLTDKHTSFEFVWEQLRQSYSETGRPSIDPELLLRILLIGYLYGITSERKLVEELRMHLAWRWFTGLGFDQEIPNHSTFSKNRHGRFQSRGCSSGCLSRLCVSAWMWDWSRASICRWTAASWKPMPPKRAAFHANSWGEAAQVKRSVRQYLAELEAQNPVEEPVHQQEQVSTTGPDSTYATKGGTPARLGYYDNDLVDSGSSMDLGNLLNRAILPPLNRCAVCGKPKEECRKLGKGKDAAPDHKFERDKILPEWHGWHAARRGLGTNLYRLGVPEKTIQAILRHAKRVHNQHVLHQERSR